MERRALLQKGGADKAASEGSRLLWPGMGGDDGPQLVPGLGRVHSICLGSAHALALAH